MLKQINQDQRLYVIPEAGGCSCLGFDVAERKRVDVLTWLGLPVPSVEIGTEAAYEAYESAMTEGRAHYQRTGERCFADCDSRVRDLVGRQVDVHSTNGETRRFTIGRSSGWMPCLLEIQDGDNFGDPLYLSPGDVVVVI
jgi:hypothetical protein